MAPPLLTAVDATSQVHLIIGSNPLAASRCTRCLEVGAKPIIIAPEDAVVHYTLTQQIEEGAVQWIRRGFLEEDLKTLGREEVDGVVDTVFVTAGDQDSKARISRLCRRLRIPVNVTDAPDLCSFTLLSTHSDGPLHIGITTSGNGCKLASRLRRAVASSLPPNMGKAVEKLGTVRRRIWEEDRDRAIESAEQNFDTEEDDATAQKHTFNALVTSEDAKNRRIRWLNQICEYWSLSRLASIPDEDVDAVLSAYTANTANPLSACSPTSRKGKIILAGSGPGHPDLLTRATYNAIKSADIILADKLVPSSVLDLIPRRTKVHIARKFPGNADKAQEELLSLGLEALREGKIVLRLKQGDPYLYGRGGEEFIFFRGEGYIPIVLPGITSAMSAPLFAGVPATHRGVADQILVCTGTGRKGVAPEPPGFVESSTVVFLMALHRLEGLVASLTAKLENEVDGRRLWPADIPCAVIERASCSDQRVIRTTLGNVCEAVETEGSRPPGLLVVGKSCHVLHDEGGKKWVVEEGFRGLDKLGDGLEDVEEIGKNGAYEAQVSK
ncbi:hypothetical protein FQN54_004390 [Arachnomyces sp. PD_36]|nr:hypothetical protein FQN54_004390 [Arachnomyces sp. PD_36]